MELKEPLSLRQKQIIMAVSLFVGLGLIGSTVWFFVQRDSRMPSRSDVGVPQENAGQLGPSQPNQEDGKQRSLYAVRTIDSSYNSVTTRPNGWFTSAQEADVMLSGIDFNDAGDALLFNHPGGVATDGTHLFLADRNNNRVLIWNTLPHANTPPDIVLGQENFITNNPGTGLQQLNWPVAVATDGTRLLVCDTYNDRVLIWNSIPTRNGQPADVTLATPGAVRDSPDSILWPWAVWTDGTRVVVTSTQGQKVLIWNTFPSSNNQSADVILHLTDAFGTPRSIASDGKHLAIGDHNAFGQQPGNFFWSSFPTRDNQPYDFFMPSPPLPDEPATPQNGIPQRAGEVMWMSMSHDGKLLALVGTRLVVWNAFPSDARDATDLTLEQRGASGYAFIAGDGSGIATTPEGSVFLSLSNANKIVRFTTIPTTEDAVPDLAIGAPNIHTNTLDEHFIMSNPVPATNGEQLIVTSDFDRRLYAWKALPNESGAKPDVVYDLPFSPWDNEMHEERFVAAGEQTIAIWHAPPLGQEADITLQSRIGSVQLREIRGVAFDEKFFYVSDATAQKIYVWNGIPSVNDEPLYTLSVPGSQRISSDGEYLAINSLSGGGGAVWLYRVSELSNNAEGTLTAEHFNLPQGATVSDGRLFIQDTNFNRVLIWKSVEDAMNGARADVTLGGGGVTTQPMIGTNTLFWPATSAFDGHFLWLGEFKFSERLLRFSVQ